MSDDGFIVSHVMDIEFDAFDALFEVFDVSTDLTIAGDLVSSQISVMRTETEIVC